MKLLHSTGTRMDVWEITGPMYSVRTNANIPVKFNGYHIVDDAAARDILRALVAEDCFTGERCD